MRTLSDNRTVMVPADDALDLPVAGDNRAEGLPVE